MADRIDEIDKRIIYALTNDARNMSAPMIADEMNVSAGTIRNRMHQLEERGIITGYHANIDYEQAADLLTMLFICTATEPDRETLALHVLDIPGVVNVREAMTGQGNFHVKAIGSDTIDLTRIARTLSEHGLDIVNEGLMQRDLFSPYQPFGPTEELDGSVPTNVLRLSGGAEIIELTIRESAPITGKTLQQAGAEALIDEDILITAIERDGTTVSPRGDTRIQPGDIVTISSHREMSNEVLRAFTPTEQVGES